MSLFNIISLFFFDFQCVTIIASFLVSIKFLKFNKNESMNYFILFTAINVIVMVPLFLMTHGVTFFHFADLLNNFSILFGFSFLSHMIISSMHDKKFEKSLYLILVAFALTIFLILILKNNKIPIHNAFAVNYWGLIFFCIIYIFKLVINIPEKKLTRIPMFWVVLGVLFCSCTAIPIILIFDDLNKDELRKNIVLCVAPTFGYSVMHLFLIKAFYTHSKNE